MQFSHIYVEKLANDYPLSKQIIKHFPSADIIEIENYKQFFNRPRQDFILQRKSPKLILAVQQNSFLEEGTERVQSFGHDRVFSCSLVRNCMYHCDYCFLQGMHQSSNIVIYVNTQDYKREIHKLSKSMPNEKIYLSSSYLSDTPAFEHFVPACSLFMDMVNGLSNITLEIRTKSDGFIHLQKIKPQDNVVLVFSLSPQEIVRKYEHGTASLHTRVLQAKIAISKNWRVRLCFDPILYSKNWEKIYEQCLNDVFSHIDAKKVEMISYGVFRMGQTFLSKMRNARPEIDVLHKNVHIDNGLGSYSTENIQYIKKQFSQMLEKHADITKAHFVHG